MTILMTITATSETTKWTVRLSSGTPKARGMILYMNTSERIPAARASRKPMYGISAAMGPATHAGMTASDTAANAREKLGVPLKVPARKLKTSTKIANESAPMIRL